MNKIQAGYGKKERNGMREGRKGKEKDQCDSIWECGGEGLVKVVWENGSVEKGE